MISIPSLGIHIGKYKPTIMTPPSNYQLVFSDDFTSFNEDDYYQSEAWGDFSASDLNQYWQRDIKDGCIKCLDEGGLILKCRHNPITLRLGDMGWRIDELKKVLHTDDLDATFSIPTECAKIRTKKVYQYGWFEADIKMPRGIGYWTAFWLAGENWPPEIDIVEAYSLYGENYDKRIGLKNLYYTSKYWRLEPNLHYGYLGGVGDNRKQSVGPTEHYVERCNENYVHYVCHWTEDFIKVYYDGYKVMDCRDEDILKWFNPYNPSGYSGITSYSSKMMVLFNHGIDCDMLQLPDCDEPKNWMYIKNFKIYQKKIRDDF